MQTGDAASTMMTLFFGFKTMNEKKIHGYDQSQKQTFQQETR
tara:strand:- start:273 stop:398 length:126 start_codon:yes stop_codon:yes gene_type:complete